VSQEKLNFVYFQFLKGYMILLSIFKLLYFFFADFLALLFKKLAPFGFLFLFILTGVSIVYAQSSAPSSEKILIQIPKGASFSQVSKTLEEKKLIKSAFLFRLASRYYTYDRQIRSGEFDIPRGLNEFDLARFLLSVKPRLRKVTIIEGLAFKDIVPILADSLSLSEAKLAALFESADLREKFAVLHSSIEGYILPQTYFFEWGITEREVISYLMKQAVSLLDAHRAAIDLLGWTDNQVLTMASIIEAESNFADEKAIVSSVYHNRLRIGYKLQADPTIIYILGKPQRVLFKHLRIDSPYNTYMYEGLPPSPINNPGHDAILAAIYPSKTKYLYFTGTGDGTGRHLFGKTLQEHNKNRAQLDKMRREHRQRR
jgi:UPF0755 protein